MSIAPERILVIFPGALGDLICFLPALSALARRHGNATIELMTRGELARFAEGRLGVAQGHEIDRPEVSLLFSEADDAATQASSFFGGFTRIYSFFAADNPVVRRVLARACNGPTSFHPFRPIVFHGNGHVPSAYLRSLGEAETVSPSQMPITLLADDLAGASRALASHGLKSGESVLLMPGSGSSSKNWPPERFADLASLLSAHCAPLILLGPAETALEPFFHQTGLPVLEDLELGEVAALARMARAFVGNDSGVSHLAAAVATPGVVIFGPTDAARWRPLGKVTVLSHLPLADLSASEVASALTELLRD